MLKDITTQRLIALSLAGLALLNFPLLVLWDKETYVQGWPLLLFGLFLVWGVLISALAWVMERGKTK